MTTTDWVKPNIDSIEGGKKLVKWIREADIIPDKNLLIICGAGISMNGPAPGPSGMALGSIFANYLRMQGHDVTKDREKNIATLYEDYCYEAHAGAAHVFCPPRHAEFVHAMTQPVAGFRFAGSPNYSHLALIEEVRKNSGKLRVYSVNVDEFFTCADTTTLCVTPPNNVIMINAFDLIGIAPDNHQHRDWQVLAAHGLLNQGDSVWSSKVLGAPLPVPPTLGDPWDRERRVLHKAIECLKCGPKYQRVIFAGLNWTLAYLIDTLENRLFPGFEWMWVNPADPPQQWLLSHGEFSPTTGNWVKSGFDELIYSFHFERYLNWLNASCSGHSQLATDISAGTLLQRRTYTQAFNRARRIYEDAAAVLSSSIKNFEMVERYHKSTDPFSPPLVTSGYQFSDYRLAKAIELFNGFAIKITDEPGSDYPKLSVVKRNGDKPLSGQIIRIKPDCDSVKLASGIMRTVMHNISLDPDLTHFVVIDVPGIFVDELSVALETEKTALCGSTGIKPDIVVVMDSDLETWLRRTTSSKRRRAKP